jgi:hypothetical protein
MNYIVIFIRRRVNRRVVELRTCGLRQILSALFVTVAGGKGAAKAPGQNPRGDVARRSPEPYFNLGRGPKAGGILSLVG